MIKNHFQTFKKSELSEQSKPIETRLKQELTNQEIRFLKYKKRYRLIFSLLTTVILATMGYLIFINLKSNPIPKTIQNDVKFVILYPQPSKQIVFNRDSFKYDKSRGQLTFIVSFDSNSITFAEQSTPEPFNASPTFFQSFIQKLNSYDTISSVDGQVGLTIPSQTKEQTAIMNAKGTLLFATSTKANLSENNWTLLFNTLQDIQPQ
jgi:hypothetical protein